MDDLKRDIEYFGKDFIRSESRQARHVAKKRGQTFNALIRRYNENPNALVEFMGESTAVGKGVCTCCNLRPIKEGNRFLCEYCYVSAGAMTDTLGTDEWIYESGALADMLSDCEEEFDEETQVLLDSICIEVEQTHDHELLS